MTTLSKQDDVCVLTIEGELTKATVDQFQELVDASLREDARDFVVQCAECSGMDSKGLEALTALHRVCQERLGMAKLCGLTETLAKILEITRLADELEVCESLEEALSALK
jgi:anti-anti-sigma factor